jgi:hypothetical protein
MNAKAYCRITHPVVTGLIAVFYSFIGWIEIHGTMHLPAPAVWFLTLAVVAPLLFGSLLTGTLHEFMHQSFFGVLPGARRSICRWHCGVLAGIVAVLAALSFWLAPQLPLESTIALSVMFLTLPLLNRRGTPLPRRFFSMIGCLLLGCILFCLLGARIYSIAMTAPWATFAAGLLTAGVCLRIGFDRHRMHDRTGRPFRSAATGVSLMFTKEGRILQATAIAEAQRQNKRIGRDWTAKSIDGSNRAWLRVLLHERFGQNSPWRWSMAIAAVAIIVTFMPLGISLLIDKLSEPAANAAQFAGVIATFGRTGATSGLSPVMRTIGLFFFMPCLITFTLALTPQPIPRVSYPFSRRRRAWLDFLLSWRMLSVGIATQVCSTFATVEFAGLLAGIPFSFENMHAQTALLFVQLPLLPLLRIANLTISRSIGLMTLSLMMLLGFFLVTPGVLEPISTFLSWSTATASLAATSFLAWIYWRRLLRWYAICDLNQSIGMIQVPVRS